MADRPDGLRQRAALDGAASSPGAATTATTATGNAERAGTASPLRNRHSRSGAPVRTSESPVASRSNGGGSGGAGGIRRRSSMISLASDMSMDSLRSTTDDLFLPRASKRVGGLHHDHDPDADHSSHLHSAPLFLAIVPAVMGIFFKNGTAIMTDLTLLGMAAIFLNWSIRIPWDWYTSAQAVRSRDSVNVEDFIPQADDDTIIEESDENDAGDGEGPAQDGQSKGDGEVAGTAPPPQLRRTSPAASPEQLAAATSLRRHEIIALIACFLGPLAGAGLLHGIREQLSRPSEGLVSNYNLTIFLLASEIRPLSHLIKLIQKRTLHLQRVVARNPHTLADSGTNVGVPASNEALATLAARIAALESGHGMPLQDADRGKSPEPGTIRAGAMSPSPPSVSKEQLVADVRRAMQPDIDALNRAVRRYEKRATLLSLQIDGRLSALEGKVSDSIALAAAAERSASGAKRGMAATLLEWAAGCIVVPIRTGVWLAHKILEIPARIGRTTIGIASELLALVKGGGGEKAKEGQRRRDDGRLRLKAKERDVSRLKVKRVA